MNTRAPINPTLLTVVLCALLLTHTYLRVAGPVSALQLVIVGVYFWLSFPTFARRLVLSVVVVLAFTALQYWLFQDRLLSTVFPERVYTYPLLFCFLLFFVVTVMTLLSSRMLVLPIIHGFAWGVLGVSGLLAGASIIWQRPDLMSVFYNNPNEFSVAIAAAFLYLAFTNSRPGLVYAAAALSIFVTYVCASRFSMLYLLGVLLLYAMTHQRQADGILGRWYRVLLVLGALLVIATVLFLFVFNSEFYVGPLDALGVVPDVIWQGWNAKISAETSMGYRVNNVLIAIGTLFQTLGLGIGLGRSPGLTEATSGLAGSIHVSPVEIVVELGVYACALLAWINTHGAPRPAIRTFLIWFGIGALGMSAQSSAYLTSYAAWFFILALCQHRLDEAGRSQTDLPASAGGYGE